MTNTAAPTISECMAAWIDVIRNARSERTAHSYDEAMHKWSEVLLDKKMRVEDTPITDLPEEAITWLASALKDYSVATERLYVTAAALFYEYLVAEEIATPNLPRIRLLIRQRTRKAGERLPQFPRDAIEAMLEYADGLAQLQAEDPKEHLRNLRDRALMITLADTGLRIHEACNLVRGDIDWNEGKAIIIGKGDKEAVVRFSDRSIVALRDYLAARQPIDGATGKPLPSLPLFARHDKGAGKKIKRVTTATGRNIVKDHLQKLLGEEAKGSIHPHSFRHYFVTTVLRATGNLKIAQELARHANITMTQRYAHLSDDELDQGYEKIFNQ